MIKWNDAEKNKPPHEKEVLVYSEDDGIYVSLGFWSETETGWWGGDYEYRIKRVIHWAEYNPPT